MMQGMQLARLYKVAGFDKPLLSDAILKVILILSFGRHKKREPTQIEIASPSIVVTDKIKT